MRSAALRRSALSLAKAFSIGLKSGLSGGKESRQGEQACPRSLDQGSHARSLVARQVVQDHDITRPQGGDENLIPSANSVCHPTQG